LWTNYLITEIKFIQIQIRYADSVSYLGFFLGVILFGVMGIKWQDRLGLRTLFKIFIILSISVNLIQYLMVEPYFPKIADFISRLTPGSDPETLRLVYFSAYNFFASVFSSLIRMSTFSLVRMVIPVTAAGSLFASFMSVANLAYSFSYASGAGLYENGLQFEIIRTLQQKIFNIPASSGENMSISLLIFIGLYLLLLKFSFCLHATG
jgi:hypothetical protein